MLADARTCFPKSALQVPADEADECVVVCLTQFLCNEPLRIREVICSTKCEVTNRFAAVSYSRQEYHADEKLLDTAAGIDQIG